MNIHTVKCATGFLIRIAKSERMKALYADPAERAAMSESVKKAWAAPELRAAQSARVKASWLERRAAKARANQKL